jgi:hypothetical protein
VLSGHQFADDFRRRVYELVAAGGMSSLRAMVSASGREHEHIAGQSLRVGVLGDAPHALEDQPVVLGDADGR